MTLDDLLSNHIDKDHHTPATIKSYQSALNQFRKDLGNRKVTAYEREDIEHWKSLVLSRASGSTWNNYHRHIRTLFNTAIKDGLINGENPFNRVRQVTKPQERIKVCELSQLTNAIKYIENNSNRFKPSWFWVVLIKIIYYTGMRRRQLVGLCWKDIDFEGDSLLLSTKHSKTKEEWSIPITEEIKPLLELTKERTLDAGIECLDTNQVFNITVFNKRYTGLELSGEQVSGMFKRLTNVLGYPISSHMLRHTMATEICNSYELGKASIQLRTLQQQLGHTDIRTTAKYIHPSIDAQAIMLRNLKEI